MKPNPIKDKSYEFAIRCIRLGNYLMENKKEYVLSKQVIRSGTSIGANIREAQNAQRILILYTSGVYLKKRLMKHSTGLNYSKILNIYQKLNINPWKMIL